MSDEETYQRGLEIRRAVVGAEYVDKSLADAEADDFTRDFQRLVTEYCWGASWGREENGVLNRRDRSLLVVMIVGALGRESELRLHLRGAVRNGVTKDEIRDALFQLAIYAGVPAALTAFRIAREVLVEAEPGD
jgi:4-carboxymuconolactone decarboxylase